MKKVNFIKYGLCTLMMSLALILCCSCSKDDEETVEKKRGLGLSNGHAYVELAGIKWATENVGKVDGVDATATDETYGYYYTKENAIKAAESWGGKWILPYAEDWKKLAIAIDEGSCLNTWVEGYSFGGKRMNGNIISDRNDPTKFIFLPSTGQYDDVFACFDEYFYGVGEAGCYWCANTGAKFREFIKDQSCGEEIAYSSGTIAMAVRPILSE